MRVEPWQRELLSPKERHVLRKIVEDLRPELLPKLENVLGKRLLEDDEADAFLELLDEVMNREALYSQNWLAADHLIGRVESQARRFW